jgi:hypothetical protein
MGQCWAPFGGGKYKCDGAFERPNTQGLRYLSISLSNANLEALLTGTQLILACGSWKYGYCDDAKDGLVCAATT